MRKRGALLVPCPQPTISQNLRGGRIQGPGAATPLAFSAHLGIGAQGRFFARWACKRIWPGSFAAGDMDQPFFS